MKLLWKQLDVQLWGKIRGRYDFQVWRRFTKLLQAEQVESLVWSALWRHYESSMNLVRKQVGEQVLGQVGEQVGEQVDGQVWWQVWEQVREQVWWQVRWQVGEQLQLESAL